MRSFLTMTAIAALCAASPLHAQTAAPFDVDSGRVAPDSAVTATVQPAQVAQVAPAPAAGASLTGLRSGAHLAEAARPLQPTIMATHGNLGQSRAMMVVGVAGLIAGAIIGGTPGTIIMVGGTVVGLVGLYEYLQ